MARTVYDRTICRPVWLSRAFLTIQHASILTYLLATNLSFNFRNVPLALGLFMADSFPGVGTADRTECAKLIPPYDQFLQVRGVIVLVWEVATNISGPVADIEQARE